MRFAILCALLITLFVSKGVAGDYAFERVIGYSSDGRYFAFEEYGVQDGSGFPYSHIFVIDLETDTFAPQTPVRVRLNNKSASLATARARAASNAKGVLKRYDVRHPAQVIYARGLGDLANSGTDLSAPVTTRVQLPSFTDPTEPSRGHFDLTLVHFPVPSVAKCPVDAVGFQLEKTDEAGKRRFIHRDEKIFKSRGCPLKYRISRVYVPVHVTSDTPFAAALVSVFTFGFEGRDRRFIVLPIPLN